LRCILARERAITNLAIAYYELREYEKALSLSERALKFNSRDFLVLDYHACILSVIEGKEQEAIKLLKRIIHTDLNKIAYGPNGEGMNWAKSIVNDCRMRLALVYQSINKKKEALKLVNEHLENRQRGVFSNFTKSEVVKRLKLLSSV
jgi:tetratricopeptide (TPR) repeat protein